MKKLITLSAAVLMVAGSASAWVVDWVEDAKPTTSGTGNMYYSGGVYGGQYYTGQIGYGALAWNSTQTAGTAIANTFADTTGLAAAAKSSLLLNGKVYFGGDGVVSSVDSDWSSNPVQLTTADSAGEMEAITTDGTYIYSNDGTTQANIHKWQVNGDNTLTLLATYNTGANRIRGVSYYDGKLYAVDHDDTGGTLVVDVFEIDIATATVSTIGTTRAGAYQVSRSGNTVLIITDETGDDALRAYDYNGGSLANETVHNLGLGKLYGVALDGENNAWVSTVDEEVAYLSIPEPSVISMVALFAGGLVFIRRKFMI